MESLEVSQFMRGKNPAFSRGPDLQKSDIAEMAYSQVDNLE